MLLYYLSCKTESLFIFLEVIILLVDILMIQGAQEYKVANKKGRFRKGLINPFITRSISHQKSTLLDLGCGSADYHSLMLKELPQLQRVIGIETSKQMLKTAVKTERSQYFCMDALDLHLQQKFDTLLAVFLIEHFNTLEKVELFVDNCKKVIKDQGELLIISIDTNSLLKSPAYQNSIKYTVVCSGELKEGEPFKVKVGKWENEDTHWSPHLLSKVLNEKGFTTKVEYIKKQQISSDYYSEQQTKQIQESHCIYVIHAIAGK